MNRTIMCNGKLVTKERVLDGYSVVIDDGIISDISKTTIKSDNSRVIDCKGNFILPGLIDIHSDVIEKIIVPRKGVKFSPLIALFDIDRQLAMQGITTIYHSISIADSTICNNNRTLKINDMFELCDLIYTNTDSLLINHKFHARLELNSISAYQLTLKYIGTGKIHELSLMNHSPGQGQYRDLNEFKKVIAQQYGDISEREIELIIRTCKDKTLINSEQLDLLLNAAKEIKIPVAYHDVEFKEQVDWMVASGMSICEFPLNYDVAKYSTENGLHCLVGAPNVILGRSHYGNVSATNLIVNKWANIICSDYYSQSLLLSLKELRYLCNLNFPEIVRLATWNPAYALGISDSIGSIEVGKRADLIVVNFENFYPKTLITMVDGIIKFMCYNK